MPSWESDKAKGSVSSLISNVCHPGDRREAIQMSFFVGGKMELPVLSYSIWPVEPWGLARWRVKWANSLTGEKHRVWLLMSAMDQEKERDCICHDLKTTSAMGKREERWHGTVFCPRETGWRVAFPPSCQWSHAVWLALLLPYARSVTPPPYGPWDWCVRRTHGLHADYKITVSKWLKQKGRRDPIFLFVFEGEVISNQ